MLQLKEISKGILKRDYLRIYTHILKEKTEHCCKCSASPHLPRSLHRQHAVDIPTHCPNFVHRKPSAPAISAADSNLIVIGEFDLQPNWPGSRFLLARVSDRFPNADPRSDVHLSPDSELNRSSHAVKYVVLDRENAKRWFSAILRACSGSLRR